MRIKHGERQGFVFLETLIMKRKRRRVKQMDFLSGFTLLRDMICVVVECVVSSLCFLLLCFQLFSLLQYYPSVSQGIYFESSLNYPFTLFLFYIKMQLNSICISISFNLIQFQLQTKSKKLFSISFIFIDFEKKKKSSELLISYLDVFDLIILL